MQEPLQTFGRYELLARLARGGMGEIYLARFNGVAGFEKRCVIKKILPELANSPTFVEKFLNEGRTLVALTHSNIVQIFDMGCENGEYYLAMEHIDGADLRLILKQFALHQQKIRIDLCCLIIMEVLKGLGYAHRATDNDGNPLGIIHRDISPSNILLSREGEVKLIDFGIAKNEQRSHESTASMVQGKFAYMSPEQARGAHLDARTDLFSVGLVFYELLTGVRPFEGTSDLQSIERIKTIDPPKLSQFRDDIPEALEHIIQTSLQKERDDRYQTADAFYDAIESFLRDNNLTPHNRDLVSELFPILEHDALVVHSSNDFLDEAFQALLDDQARQDRSTRTRSMCLTQSFSKELPNAVAEDFSVTANTLPKPIATKPEDSVTPSSNAVIHANPNLPIQAQQTPEASPKADDIPVLSNDTPIKTTRKQRFRNMMRRIRYILIGFTLALLACFFMIRYYLLHYDIHALADNLMPSQAQNLKTDNETTDDKHTLALDAEFATKAHEPKEKEEVRKHGIDLMIQTTPPEAHINVIQASYAFLDDHHIKLIADSDAEFEILAEGYKPCHFNLIFDESMPRLEWQHCAGVSTKYTKDFDSAVLEISLTKLPPANPIISPVKPLAKPSVAARPAHTSDKAPKTRQNDSPANNVPQQHRISVRANIPAILSLSGHDYALPTEVVAHDGELAVIRPTANSHDILLPYSTPVTDKNTIEVEFCRALIHIAEFYVPGDPSPYQIADIKIDGVTLSKNTDMATFVLPCGKHTFSAEFQSDHFHLSATQDVTVKSEQTYKGVMTLK